MRKNIQKSLILAVAIACCTMVACREKPGTPISKHTFLLEMDFEDWLLRQAVWPANANVQLLAREASDSTHAGAMHPVDRLAQVLEAHAWTDSLPIWFPDILAKGAADDPSILKLRQAYGNAILLVSKSASRRLQDSCEIIVQNDGRIEIVTNLSNSEGNLGNLLQLEGKLGFYETWNYDEVIAGIAKMREATFRIEDGDTVFDVFDLGAEHQTGFGQELTELSFVPDRPVVWFAQTADTATVGQIFRTHSSNGAFPTQIKFAWSNTELTTAPGIFELIALKTMDTGKPRLEGTAVKFARQDFEPGTVAPMVSIEMYKEGAWEWSRMTRSNLQRCVAIVFDGLVFTFPTVQSEISGGRSQITGNFTVDEAKTLATVLKSGAYPAKVKIVAKNGR